MGAQGPNDSYRSLSFFDELDRQKAADDWLPITSSRNARWWYSTVHNVTAIVGAGVLSLPYAMAQLGWGPGLTILVLSWVLTFYTIWQMVEMHEMIPGRRFDRYHELGQYAFGEKLGLYIVVPLQLVVEVGVNIVYMVTGGKSLKKFHETVCPDCKRIRLTLWIFIFGSVHFVLAHLPSFNTITSVSCAAAVMSFCTPRLESFTPSRNSVLASYSCVAWIASAEKGVRPDVQYGYKSDSVATNVFNFFTALGDIGFAYGGHNIVLEIQATIPSTPGNPSKGPMWRGVVVAYIVVGLCYFPVAIIGYWVFGNTVENNILVNLDKPSWLIAMANMFIVIHLVGSYQIYAIPVFDMIESMVVNKFHIQTTGMIRFVIRNVYVGFTLFIAISFPFFSALLSVFGGFGFIPTTYFLPCVIWLAINKPRKYSFCWWINWFSIVFGVALMIVAPIGGVKEMINEGQIYKFYS